MNCGDACQTHICIPHDQLLDPSRVHVRVPSLARCDEREKTQI